MRTCLQIQDLVKDYGSVTALDQVSLRVEHGAVLALLGPNGAGKSTLFGCLLGLIRPTSGTVLFRGEPITDAVRARFGYTPERVALYAQRTVEENGLFFASLRGQGKEELDRQLQRTGLESVRHRKVRHLSKGMAQRLGLAIALCGAPDLLILDEPFNGLDPVVLDRLLEILREESERGATLLISTHTISAIQDLATDIAILLEGRLALAGTVEEAQATWGSTASLEEIYHGVAHRRRALTEELLV